MEFIKVKNVTKRFGDKIVLDNISFNVNEGDIFGLIGPNGAGKSTLINIITGLITANSGEVYYKDLSIDKDDIKIKRELGVVPQDIALIQNVSAVDNLKFFGSLYGLRGSLLKERINEALEITGLMDRKNDKVKKYSGGMMRRLNIAAAVMHKPKVLILDEPTVGIDPQSRNHIFEFIKKINKENNTTIIYTSHYMEEVEQLCNSIYIMDLGKEVAYGSKEKVKSLLTDGDKVTLKLRDYNGDLLVKLEKVNGVIDLKENNDQLTFSVNDKFKIADLLYEIEKYGAKILSINIEEPSLEEVFLTLTGKNLRD